MAALTASATFTGGGKKQERISYSDKIKKEKKKKNEAYRRR
jgi:hypothetical protein